MRPAQQGIQPGLELAIRRPVLTRWFDEPDPKSVLADREGNQQLRWNSVYDPGLYAFTRFNRAVMPLIMER